MAKIVGNLKPTSTIKRRHRKNIYFLFSNTIISEEVTGSLTNEQHNVYRPIIHSVESNTSKVFLLSAPDGKENFYKLGFAKVRNNRSFRSCLKKKKNNKIGKFITSKY